MSFKWRNVHFGLDLTARNWSVPPIEVIVKPDYTILFWKPTKWTREALPIMMIVTNYCLDCNGTRSLTFTVTSTKTSRRGKSGNRRHVNMPRSLLFFSRTIKYSPHVVGAPNMSGELWTRVNGSLAPLCSSGIFFDYYRRWITPPQPDWYVGFTNYNPAFDETLNIPFVYGDGMLSTIDDETDCLNACSVGERFITSSSEYLVVFGSGKKIVSYELPSGPAQILNSSSLVSGSDSLTISTALRTLLGDILRPLYVNSNLDVVFVSSTPTKLQAIIRVLSADTISMYDSSSALTTSLSSTCSIAFDHIPLYRLTILKCASTLPPKIKVSCNGLVPGWHVRYCVEWNNPTTNTRSSLCNTFFLFPPTGLPFEGSDWMANLVTYSVDQIVVKLNDNLRSSLGSLVLGLPPTLRVFGRIVLMIYTTLNIQVSVRIFFCPPVLLPGDPPGPSCSADSSLLVVASIP